MRKGTAVFVAFITLLGGYFVYEGYRPAPSAPQESAESSSSDLMSYIRPAVPEDDTADWKTYRNEKYGFEVKYPSSWEISKREIPEPDSVGFRPIGTEHFYFIRVRTHDNSKHLSPEEFFDPENNKKGGFSADPRAIQYSFFKKIQPTVYTVAGIPSSLFDHEFFPTILIPHTGKIYDVMRLKGDLFDQFNTESIFSSMLSTFKFIK